MTGSVHKSVAAVPDPTGAAAALPVYAAAAAAILFWSGTAIANKVAVAHIDPSSAGILRSMLAGLVAGGLATTLRLPFPQRADQRALLLLSGLSCFAVWPMLMSLGLGHTSASHAALIMAMLPAFTGLIAAAFERAWPRASWWAGVVLAAIGTFALIFYRSGGALVTENASMTGDLIILAGVVICAFGYVCGGKLSPVIGPFATTFWGLAMATVFNLPALAVLAHCTDWSAVGSTGWLAVAYLTIFSSLVGYIAWFWALGRGGIARIGSWQLAMPVTTLAFAALLLGETITWPLAISGLAILAGTALAQLPKRGARD